MILAIYGLFLPGLGEWERGVKFIENARMLNPQLSSQYYIPTCLNYYRKGDIDRAYAESLHINTPGLFWEPLVTDKLTSIFMVLPPCFEIILQNHL